MSTASSLQDLFNSASDAAVKGTMVITANAAPVSSWEATKRVMIVPLPHSEGTRWFLGFFAAITARLGRGESRAAWERYIATVTYHLYPSIISGASGATFEAVSDAIKMLVSGTIPGPVRDSFPSVGPGCIVPGFDMDTLTVPQVEEEEARKIYAAMETLQQVLGTPPLPTQDSGWKFILPLKFHQGPVEFFGQFSIIVFLLGKRITTINYDAIREKRPCNPEEIRKGEGTCDSGRIASYERASVD